MGYLYEVLIRAERNDTQFRSLVLVAGIFITELCLVLRAAKLCENAALLWRRAALHVISLCPGRNGFVGAESWVLMIDWGEIAPKVRIP